MMKENTLQNVIHFIFRYIWIFCLLLVIIEGCSTVSTAGILMEQSAKGMLQSVCGEVSGRVDGVLRLLTGISHDEVVSDTSLPLFDRAIRLRHYQDSYGLYMIALTDENMDVVSADETEPSAEHYNLGYRDYMQELYSTGTYQITDAMVAGADHKTVNYTIAVPILKNGQTAGSVFGSIYFDDIKEIIERAIGDHSRGFYLMGKENTIMAGDSQDLIGKTYLEVTQNLHIFGSTAEEVNGMMQTQTSGGNWELENGSLWYVTYRKVPPTEWTLVYRVRFTSIIAMLLPGLLLKIGIYVILCTLVYIFGPRILRRHLADVNHLLERMSSMQKELFATEQTNYENLLELTQEGLTDHLTGLATRAVLLKKSGQFLSNGASGGTLLFVDLDDLKRLNDNFGHEAGDCALIYFGQILKKYELSYNGIASRYGGDEFVIILTDVQEQDALTLADKICGELSTALTVKERTFTIHGSVGITVFPKQGTALEELICKADLALYTAKREGKNRCSLYEEKN